MRGVLAGGIAGCLATVPMTVAMDLMHRGLPRGERYPLPPRQVAMNAAKAVDALDQLEEPDRENVTLVSHFGMGTAMGAIYGGLAAHLPIAGPVAGSSFGFGVWAANYLGVLPATGLLSSATRHPVRRTALMIAAHLVWGASAGCLLQAMLGAGRRNRQARLIRPAESLGRSMKAVTT